ncbi:MAG: hypothetical protein ACYCU7_13570 [Acidimicrobiales bacterium]
MVPEIRTRVTMNPKAKLEILRETEVPDIEVAGLTNMSAYEQLTRGFYDQGKSVVIVGNVGRVVAIMGFAGEVGCWPKDEMGSVMGRLASKVRSILESAES